MVFALHFCARGTAGKRASWTRARGRARRDRGINEAPRVLRDDPVDRRLGSAWGMADVIVMAALRKRFQEDEKWWERIRRAALARQVPEARPLLRRLIANCVVARSLRRYALTLRQGGPWRADVSRGQAHRAVCNWRRWASGGMYIRPGSPSGWRANAKRKSRAVRVGKPQCISRTIAAHRASNHQRLWNCVATCLLSAGARPRSGSRQTRDPPTGAHEGVDPW